MTKRGSLPDDTVTADYYSELCCELCMEVIHNHFDCPACEKNRAPTDAYHPIDLSYKDVIGCESCGTKFHIHNKDVNTLKLSEVDQ